MKMKHVLSALVITVALGTSLAPAASATPFATVLNGTGVTGTISGAGAVALIRVSTATIGCTSIRTTVDLANNSTPYPITIGSNLVLSLSGCRVAGINTLFSCVTSTVAVTGTSVLDDTPLSWAVNCRGTVVPTGCTFSLIGAAPGTFNNVTQVDTLSTAAGLATTSSGCTTVVPNGPATLTGPSGTPIAMPWPASLRMLSSP